MPAKPQEALVRAPPTVAEAAERNVRGAGRARTGGGGGPELVEEAAAAAESTGGEETEATMKETSDPEVILFKFREVQDDFLYVGNNKRPIEDRCTTLNCNCDEKDRSANLEQFCTALRNVVDCRSKMCPFVVSKCLLSQKEFGVLFSWLELGQEDEKATSSKKTNSNLNFNHHNNQTKSGLPSDASSQNNVEDENSDHDPDDDDTGDTKDEQDYQLEKDEFNEEEEEEDVEEEEIENENDKTESESEPPLAPNKLMLPPRSRPTIATVGNDNYNNNEPLRNTQESPPPPRSLTAQEGDGAIFASFSFTRTVFNILDRKESRTSKETHNNSSNSQTETEPLEPAINVDTTESMDVDSSVTGSDPPAAATQPPLFNKPESDEILSISASGSARTSGLFPKKGVPGSGTVFGAPTRTTSEESSHEQSQSESTKDKHSPMNFAQELELMRRDSFIQENLEAATTIHCRSIRFGTYKYLQTSGGAVASAQLTQLGFVLEVPFSKNPTEMKRIEIPKGAITKIIGNTGEMLPTLILQCTADYAQWVCGQLGLDGNNKNDRSLYYCPETGAPSQRDIVMIMIPGSESVNEMLTTTFQEVYLEVDVDTINKYLIEALPKGEDKNHLMRQQTQEEESDSSWEPANPPPTGEKTKQKHETEDKAEKRNRKVKKVKKSPVPGSSTKKRQRRDSSSSTCDENNRAGRHTRGRPAPASVKKRRVAAVKAKNDIRKMLQSDDSSSSEQPPKDSEPNILQNPPVESDSSMESAETRFSLAVRELESATSATEESETEGEEGKEKEAHTMEEEGNQVEVEMEIDKEKQKCADTENEHAGTKQPVTEQEQEQPRSPEAKKVESYRTVASYNSDRESSNSSSDEELSERPLMERLAVKKEKGKRLRRVNESEHDEVEERNLSAFAKLARAKDKNLPVLNRIQPCSISIPTLPRPETNQMSMMDDDDDDDEIEIIEEVPVSQSTVLQSLNRRKSIDRFGTPIITSTRSLATEAPPATVTPSTTASHSQSLIREPKWNQPLKISIDKSRTTPFTIQNVVSSLSDELQQPPEEETQPSHNQTQTRKIPTPPPQSQSSRLSSLPESSVSPSEPSQHQKTPQKRAPPPPPKLSKSTSLPASSTSTETPLPPRRPCPPPPQLSGLEKRNNDTTGTTKRLEDSTLPGQRERERSRQVDDMEVNTPEPPPRSDSPAARPSYPGPTKKRVAHTPKSPISPSSSSSSGSATGLQRSRFLRRAPLFDPRNVAEKPKATPKSMYGGSVSSGLTTGIATATASSVSSSFTSASVTSTAAPSQSPPRLEQPRTAYRNPPPPPTLGSLNPQNKRSEATSPPRSNDREKEKYGGRGDQRPAPASRPTHSQPAKAQPPPSSKSKSGLTFVAGEIRYLPSSTTDAGHNWFNNPEPEKSTSNNTNSSRGGQDAGGGDRPRTGSSEQSHGDQIRPEQRDLPTDESPREENQNAAEGENRNATAQGSSSGSGDTTNRGRSENRRGFGVSGRGRGGHNFSDRGGGARGRGGNFNQRGSSINTLSSRGRYYDYGPNSHFQLPPPQWQQPQQWQEPPYFPPHGPPPNPHPPQGWFFDNPPPDTFMFNSQHPPQYYNYDPYTRF